MKTKVCFIVSFLMFCFLLNEAKDRSLQFGQIDISDTVKIKKFKTEMADIELQFDTAKAIKLIEITPGLEDSTKQQLKNAIASAPEIAKGIKEVIKIAQSRDQYNSTLDWIIDLLWKIALAWGLFETAVRKLTFLPRKLSVFYWFKKIIGKHNGFQLVKNKNGNINKIKGTWQGDIFVPEGHSVEIIPIDKKQ